MGTKLCPICDSSVNSINFCKTCKRFVTPIENNHTFYLNERRSDVDYQRDYNFDGDVYDYSADKMEVEDTVSDCHDEFEFDRDEQKDFHDGFGSDHNEDYNRQENQKAYSDIQNGQAKATEGEWKSWQNRAPGTSYNTGNKKKKASALAVIGVIIGLCCKFLPIVFDHIKDDLYETDTEDEYIEDDTYTDQDTEWDNEDIDDASLAAPDGYMYYTSPGEKQGSDGNYYTALSAEEVSENGGECTLVGHYDGTAMADFESDMLAGAQNMGIDLQEDEYGRYLGLYKYDDGNTCYEKKDSFYADMGFLRVAVYGDYNSDRIHSLMIAQKIQDGNDYYRMDDIYTIIANALDEPDLESGSGYDSVIAGLHTLRDATDTSDETGNNYTEVHIGEWEISVSRLGGYLYIDMYVEQ